MTRPRFVTSFTRILPIVGVVFVSLFAAGCYGGPEDPVARVEGDSVTRRDDTVVEGTNGLTELTVRDGARETRVRALASDVGEDGLRTFWAELRVVTVTESEGSRVERVEREEVLQVRARGLAELFEGVGVLQSDSLVTHANTAVDKADHRAGGGIKRRAEDVLVDEASVANIGIGGGGR